MARRKLDPAKLAERMKFWRGEVGRVGRGDRRGGVFRLPGHDHDGNRISPEEEARLDRAAGCEHPDDDPLLRDE